jgi:peptide/nickel transport system substrate-binding protein
LLRTHALDYFFQPSINTYPSLSTIPDTRVLFVNMNGYEGVLFNTQRPLVRDVRVRRAIAYIIDKPQLVKTLTYGQEQAATEDLPSWMWAFDPSVPPYPHDPRAAQQLLKDAGWTRGPDGILRNGAQRMSLTLIVSISNAASRKLAVELQAMLAQAGIEVAVHAYPEDILYAPAGAGGILHGGKFDIDVSPWFAGIDPDDSSQFMCKYVPPVGYNDTRYCNPQMDAAQERALTSYDVATRKAAYAQIQSLLYRDVPALFIWWQRDQEAVSDRFKGFAPNPTVETWNAWQWSI